jgi:UDP-glucose 4-epimerase
VSSTVLVTGATGFVGRHLVRGLAERGHRVVALVRDSSNREPIADHVDAFRVADLSRPETLVGVVDGVDAVIHSACAVASTFDAGRSAEDAFMAVNRDGTVNLAREIVRSDGPRMVHVSSTAAVGYPPAGRVDESVPCDPRTPYQRSKRAAEVALLDLHQDEGLDVAIVRPCVVAGPGKDRSELRTLLKWVRAGRFPLVGNQPDVHKPIIDVDDLVSALIAATSRGDAGGIWFVHSDGGHTLGDMLRAAAEVTGARYPWVPVPLLVARAAATVFETAQRLAPDLNPPLTHDRIDLFVTDRRIDVSRARTELGWAPQRQDLVDMLGRTYRYYQDRGLL